MAFPRLSFNDSVLAEERAVTASEAAALLEAAIVAVLLPIEEDVEADDEDAVEEGARASLIAFTAPLIWAS